MSNREPGDVADTHVLELLGSYYSAARSELIQRMVLREGTLTLFLGATAAIFSFAAGADDNRGWALFVIPFLGLGTASINLQHTTSIRSIGRYLATEFQAEVTRAVPSAPVHWDVSRSRHAGLRGTSFMRAVAALLLIVVPEVVAGVTGYLTVGRSSQSTAALVLSGVAALISVLLLARGYSARPWDSAVKGAALPAPRPAENPAVPAPAATTD